MADEAMKDVEQDSGEQKAKDKMQQVFGDKPQELKHGQENVDHSLDEELKRRDDDARADIVAMDKEGKKVVGKPAGMDEADWKAVKEILDRVPKDGHLTRANLTGPEKINGKDYYFVAVYDGVKKTTSYFAKEGSNFTVNDREFVRNLDDSTYEKLMGKKREKKADA